MMRKDVTPEVGKAGILEFARSQEFIGRHLPSPPKVVLDVEEAREPIPAGLRVKDMKSISLILCQSTLSRRRRLRKISRTILSPA